MTFKPWPRFALPVAVLIAVTLVYLNHFHNGFHFDDGHSVVNNPNIRSLFNIPRFFLDARTFSNLPVNQMYRPVSYTHLTLPTSDLV